MAENHRYEPAGATTGPNAPAITEPVLAPKIDGLPEKYKSVADLAKAHEEAERKITELSGGGVKKPDAAGADGKTGDETQTPKVDPPAQKRLTADARQKYFKEIVANGTLSEASYKELDDAGYDKEMVDTYVRGQRSEARDKFNEALTAAGQTPESWPKVSEWASKNVPKEELSLINAALDAGDLAQIVPLMKGLKAQYELATAGAPQSPFRKQLMGGSGASASESPFGSMAEARRAMRDPRYGLDPAYRAQVIKRMAITPDTVE